MTIQNYSDLDPQETQEWLDALEAVLEAEGLQRAHFLLGELQDKARATGVHMPYSANTPYCQHHPGRSGGVHPRRPRHGMAHPFADSLERAGHGDQGQPHHLGTGRPHRQLRLQRHPV
jgi:hypothetical protein